MNDLAALPKEGEYLTALLRAAMRATGAVAAAVWTASNDSFRLECELGLLDSGLASDSALQALHEETLGQVLRVASDEPNLVTARQTSEYRYHFLPGSSPEHPRLVVELVHATAYAGGTAVVEQALATLVKAAQEFMRAQQQLSWQRKESLWSELQSIVPQLHSGLRMAEVAYHIANEGRQFVGCDRLSVASVSGSRVQLLSVSGVASIERRAKQVRDLETLVAVVAKSRRPLHFPQEGNLPPQIDDALQVYIDSSHCQRLSIVLVMSASEPSSPGAERPAGCCAALVFESFTDRNHSDDVFRTQWLVQHAELALRNAFQLENLPLLGLSLRLRAMLEGYQAKRLGIWAGACVGGLCLVLLAIVPADLDIQATGTLQPQQLRHIYAPANGEIVELRAHHQDHVRVGDELIVIRSRESELKKEELLTQRGITQEKLRSIEGARLNDRRPSHSELLSNVDLSASERELREMLSSQEQQLAILNEMVKSLTLTSPIEGRVISWNPAESLERRPVQQGQKLMSVAQRDGAGLLVLRVLDEDIRYLQQAQMQHATPVSVSFVIASDPGQLHAGQVSQIGTIAETLTGEGASIRVAATVAAVEMKNATPGATVNAKIHCGRAAIGYVWTRRLWDFLLMRLI